jgi:RNA polymerase sigma factor (sigma-70 family)
MAPRVADSEWAMEATPTPAQRAAPKRVPLGFARMGDERLSQLVGSGRERAFAVLYERYHQPLYRYCRSLVRNDADAQDVLQSVFALAFTALRDGKRNAPLRPWLYRIPHNEAISLLRRRRDGEQELSDSVVPPVASAADQADERARMALLVADLEQLPERQRVALLMRELNGLSHADIALVLGTSVGAAKQAIFDARSALLDLAEGRAMECEEVRRKVSERDRRALRGRRLRSHLRDCSHCAAFAAAIPERRSDLQALAPFLPPSAAAALFRRTVKSAAGHGAGTGPGGAASAGIGSGGSGAGGAATAGAAGKVGGAALVSKTIAGAAIVAAAAAGVGGLTKVLPPRAGRGLAVKTHIQHAPRATAGVGRNYVGTAGAGGVGSRGASSTAAGSVVRSGVGGSAASAAGSPGHAAVLSGHSRQRSGGAGGVRLPAGIGAGSVHGMSHGHSPVSGSRGGASHGHGGPSHGNSAGSQRQSAAPRGAHHATGPSQASPEAGRRTSTGSQHPNSAHHPAGGPGSAVAHPVPVSPPGHSSPNSATTTTTTVEVSSTATHGIGAHASPGSRSK